jgi:hypothetical protein
MRSGGSDDKFEAEQSTSMNYLPIRLNSMLSQRTELFDLPLISIYYSPRLASLPL